MKKEQFCPSEKYTNAFRGKKPKIVYVELLVIVDHETFE